MNERPWLFSHYKDLRGKIPFTSLGNYPSPVHRLEHLSKKTGADIWIKRDDTASDIYGGNKCRMMEWIIPDAISKGRKSLVTWGALGSNQVLSSVIYGMHMGYSDIVAVHNDQPYHPYVKRNFLISTSLGVQQYMAENPLLFIMTLGREYLKKYASGKKPYLIPLLGSSPLSILSYLDAALELKKQIEAGDCPAPDYIFITVGTGGTAAGLILGSLLFREIGKVVGVRIIEKAYVNEAIVAWEIRRTIKFLKKLGVELGLNRVTKKDIMMIHDFFGEGYAEPTGEAVSAIRLVKELEGIDLDITYTAKSMAALFAHAAKDKKKRYLFWHTLNTVDLGPFTEKLPDNDHIPERFRRYLTDEGK
jgi:D-cysteine desulfhydrase